MAGIGDVIGGCRIKSCSTRPAAPVPQAMQLRYLAMLFDIAGERSSTIVLPFPIYLLREWSGRTQTN